MKTLNKTTPKPETPVIKMEPDDEILSASEAASFLKMRKLQIYQLTHGKKLRYFKPSHRCIRFLKSDLIKFILQNPSATREEMDEKSQKIYDNLTN